VPPPWKIVQTPGFVVIVYEAFNLWRQIFLDGRELGEDFTPTWMGYSTGKWEGDTLVVDTRGFNGKTWLDQAGKPATDALHVVERLRRCREASADREAGVVFRWRTKPQGGRKTTPTASTSVASQHFLDDAATPPCSDARRGIRSIPIRSHLLERPRLVDSKKNGRS